MPRPHVFDAGEDQAQFLLRRHRQPVARPHVGAEHYDAALVQAIEQSLVRRKSRKAEERRSRPAAALAIKCQFVGLDAAVDLDFRRRRQHHIQQRMRISVMADRVALGQFAPGDFRMRFDISAEQEEGCLHAFSLQRIQHLRRGGRPGTVIEGEDQFFGRQRQSSGELLAADPRCARGIDVKHALGAERVGIARAGPSHCGRAGGQAGEQGSEA